ncbi:MAG: hypothetical protein M1823_005447 [Watsoniomyces obsoletus]|nr:MAG: hypothetical protein M1823_005447 [Watsoniomyces obsoletus]
MALNRDAIWAPCPTTTRGQATPLSADAKGQRIAYASNKSIFLRSIDHPSQSTQYTDHKTTTTVARFAPSGYYVASGDVSGTVREYNIISGRINDIAWDGDSQRIIAVGDGKQRFGHCITADSGNSVGEISGHSAVVNCVAIRQQRPLRAATGSDDTSIVFYHGAPFKFNTSLRGQHNNYIYGVGFSPDGANLVSVGADRKIWLYDGKSGELKTEIGKGEHKGSIFGVSWASDSKRLVTASADRTVKVWDVEAGKAVQSWEVGKGEASTIPHQQVGVVWPAGRSDGLIISLSLSGDLSYWVEGSEKPTQTIQGHQKSITAAQLSQSSSGGDTTLWTGSYEGRVCSWDVANGRGHSVEGQGHSNQIIGFAESLGSKSEIFSTAWDDTLRIIDPSAKQFLDVATTLSAQPKAVASVGQDFIAVITGTALQIYKNGSEVVTETPMKATPLALAATEGGEDTALVAIGDEDKILRLYSFDAKSSTLRPGKELTASTAPVTSLAFSPNRMYLAAGNSIGKILVYDVSDGKMVVDRWSAHTARVTSIAWNAASTHAASGGLDTNLFVWSMAAPGKRIKVINAHKDGVNGVFWSAQHGKIISVGADAAIKLWRVEL